MSANNVWLAGVMPSDDEPDSFSTHDEAKRALISIMRADADLAETEEEAEDLTALAEDVNLCSGEIAMCYESRLYFVRKG